MQMKIKGVKFLGSFLELNKCPQTIIPEYAFIGRSNVGKSSLINCLCATSTAMVSNRPGKTQMMNFFDVDAQPPWRLIDLPGYGYAKVPKAIRKGWDGMVKGYLTQREYLACAFLLIDSCVPPQQKDLDFANWLGEVGVPFALVFTKLDRRKVKRENENFLEDFRAAMLRNWQELPPIFLSSSETGEGRDEILAFIQETNTL